MSQYQGSDQQKRGVLNLQQKASTDHTLVDLNLFLVQGTLFHVIDLVSSVKARPHVSVHDGLG